MPRSSLSLLLLFASASALGQQAPLNSPPNSPRSATTTPLAATAPGNEAYAEGCPVGLFVDRRSNLVTRLAEDGRPTGPEQGLHISLTNESARIKSAEITVYGVTAGSRVLPVNDEASHEISKTFVLHPSDGRNGLQEATVWIERTGVLTRVELNSLTYADGSGWTESAGSKCRAVPSLFVPVAAR